MTEDLAAWIRTQLDEDERKARAATAGPWRWVDPLLKKTKLALVGDQDSTVLLAASADAHPSAGDAEHIANFDPPRALAEVESKKRILDEILNFEARIDGEWGCCHSAEDIAAGLCPDPSYMFTAALRALALPFADRPGFREEWRP